MKDLAMSFRDQFPDFDPAAMPAIPANWTDDSWRNEPCPFFTVSPSWGVYVDYENAAEREFPESPRFVVVRMDHGQHMGTLPAPPLATDDWDHVLEFIAGVTA